MKAQQEIIDTAPLLQADDRLTTAGWSAFPKLDSNLEDAHFTRSNFHSRCA